MRSARYLPLGTAAELVRVAASAGPLLPVSDPCPRIAASEPIDSTSAAVDDGAIFP